MRFFVSVFLLFCCAPMLEAATEQEAADALVDMINADIDANSMQSQFNGACAGVASQIAEIESLLAGYSGHPFEFAIEDCKDEFQDHQNWEASMVEGPPAGPSYTLYQAGVDSATADACWTNGQNGGPGAPTWFDLTINNAGNAEGKYDTYYCQVGAYMTNLTALSSTLSTLKSDVEEWIFNRCVEEPM